MNTWDEIAEVEDQRVEERESAGEDLEAQRAVGRQMREQSTVTHKCEKSMMKFTHLCTNLKKGIKKKKVLKKKTTETAMYQYKYLQW